MREDPSSANDVLKSLRDAGPGGSSATLPFLSFVQVARIPPEANASVNTSRLIVTYLAAERSMPPFLPRLACTTSGIASTTVGC
jgi:hypothetical protein